MQVKIHFLDTNYWITSDDKKKTVEHIGSNLVASYKPVCKIRDDGRWVKYDFEGQPTLRVSAIKGQLLVEILEDNEVVKDIYVDDKLIFKTVSNGKGKTSMQGFATATAHVQDAQVVAQAELPKRHAGLRVGMIVGLGDKCGISEHTKYFLDKLKCDYRVYPPTVSFEDIMRDEVDIVHLQHEFGLFDSNNLIDLVTKLKNEKVKVILDLHTVSSADFNETMAAIVDKIVVHNPLAKGDVPYSRKIEVVPLATPIGENLDKQQQRQKYGVSGSPVVASFGFVNRNKGLTETLEALAQLKPEFPKICLLLVGSLHPRGKEHDYLNYLHNHARELGVNVVWKNEFYPIEIVHQLLSCADLHCLFYKGSSVLSGSGTARVCLASHRPLVVSNISTFAEFRDAVVRVSDGNVSELAEAIHGLLRDKAHQKALIEKGDSFLKGISGEFVARRFEEIYREVGGK